MTRISLRAHYLIILTRYGVTGHGSRVTGHGCHVYLFPVIVISFHLCSFSFHDPDLQFTLVVAHLIDMSGSNLQKMWLVACNFITAAAFGRVAMIIAVNGLTSLSDGESTLCLDALVPATRLALGIGFIEVFNCIAGFTRSPLPAVLLFSCTRAGVEYMVAPLIPCGSWQHLLCVTMWSIGDLVRFGCFTIDTAIPGIRMVKSVRFTVGPILFPFGAFAEMMMVFLAASNGQPMMYLAGALWPFFFYPMMQQLLKQRRKHFSPKDKKKQIKAV